MQRIFTDKEKKDIEQLYLDGYSINKLCKIYHTSKNKISEYLCSLGYEVSNKKKPSKYFQKDIDFLKAHYPKMEWDALFEYFGTTNKQTLHTLTSKYGIKSSFRSWTSEKDEIVKNNMYYLSWKEIAQLLNNEYSEGAIATHARKKLGYTNDSRYWSEEEISIMYKFYENKTMDEMCELLPNRKRHHIASKAVNLNLKSPDRGIWSDYEDQYIKDNWFLQSDYLMSQVLNRSFRSVKWRRELLGLYRQNKQDKNYSRLSDYLRRNSIEWKKKSISNCNYKCIITGSKSFQVHHLYPVNKIIDDVLNMLKIPFKEFKEYSNEELQKILDLFRIIQDELLGVCIDTKLHKLFHKLYGFDNTKEQFDIFVKDFKEGRYSELIKET